MRFRSEELYPDVMPCLEELRRAGYRIAVAGNHFADFTDTPRRMNLPLDFVGSWEERGVEKPSPDFFTRIVQSLGEIAYVGDRIDNNVLPAQAVGMVSVFRPRGPWGLIQARWPEAGQADIVSIRLRIAGRTAEDACQLR